MPLQPDLKEDFVQVKIINVASDENVINTDDDSNDFKVRLTDIFSNVVAIEMENYQVPLTAVSQFTDGQYIDFRLRNPAIFGGNWKTFTAVVPIKPVIYNTPQLPNADLISTLVETFASVILKDPDFGSKVDIIPLPQTDESLTLVCRTLAYPPLATWPGYGTTECELLFGTGPNKERSAARTLGFDPIDYAFFPVVILGTLFQFRSSPFPALINKFRYLDVFLDEVPEFQPFQRIYLPTIDSYSTSLPENAGRVRFLRQPIRNLKELTIRLRLPKGLKPFTPQVYFFSFRVFTLNSNFRVPEAQKNRLKLI